MSETSLLWLSAYTLCLVVTPVLIGPFILALIESVATVINKPAFEVNSCEFLNFNSFYLAGRVVLP